MTDISLNAPLVVNADSYSIKQFVFHELERYGMDSSDIIYSLDPLSSTPSYPVVLLRTNKTGAEVLGNSKPTVIPKNGTVCNFCLKASPTKHETFSKKRIPEEPEIWFEKIKPQLGLNILEVFSRSRLQYCGKKPGFYLPEGIWVGKATVSDEERLRVVIFKGVGRHKAFGYGLLQIIP